MKSSLMWITFASAVLLISTDKVNAWGGLFNRFSPEMLQNMGYGNHGGGYHSFLQNEVDEEPIIEEDPCYARKCYSNENCCPGQVCFNVDDSDSGVCLFVYGRKMGELCRTDADCEAGLTCDNTEPNGQMVCVVPIITAKQYAQDCIKSSECDITKGLCCQLQRRHRQAPRKVCSYFKDPLTCIGTVAVDQIKHEVQHTAGEKRITSAFKHGLN